MVVFLESITSFFGKIAQRPKVKALLEKIGENKFFKPIWEFFERFYWRNYAKDRLDLSQTPAAAESTLRSLFRLSAIMCLSIPFSGLLSKWPVTIEAFNFQGTAPISSVLIWMYALPGAWAALLTGSAFCNRGIFAVVAISATYFLTTCVLGLARSEFNALLSTAVLFALFFCERRLKKESKLDIALGVANAVLAGSAVGVQLVALTPIKPALNSFIHNNSPNLTITSGIIIGSVLALICFGWARIPENQKRPYFFRGAQISIHTSCLVIWLLLGAYLIAGLFRGSLKDIGSMILSSVNLSNNYLWPVWYFIGVGIMYKLIGSTKVIAGSFEGILAKKLLGPGIIVLLVASLCISFSEIITMLLVNYNQPISNLLFPFWSWLFHISSPSIWSQPNNVMTVNWFRWVLIADTIVVVTLAFQRRLSSIKLMRLFFLNVLAALLLWEYSFQLSSFARTPTDSLLVIFLFSIWLLWLMHTVAAGVCSISTPKWPKEGRFTIFGAVTTLVILQIYARASCKDFKLMNEFFLCMFRGVIDFGMPYYLLMWSSKRLDRIPTSIPSMLGHFVCGALCALAFNAIEKLSAAGWSIDGLNALTQKQLSLLETVGNANLDLNIPVEFFAVRTVLFVVLLMAIAFIGGRRYKKNPSTSSIIFFCLISFASGVASFTNSLMELPLPTYLRALTAPVSQELTFNCNIIQTFLSFWIPALLVAHAQFSTPSKRGSSLLWRLPLACAIGFSISAGYSQLEVLFRATLAIYPLMIILLAALFILLIQSLTDLKSDIEVNEPVEITDAPVPDLASTEPEAPDLDAAELEPEDPELKEPILTTHTTFTILLALVVFLIPIVCMQLASVAKPMEAKVIAQPISLLSNWSSVRTADESTSVFRKANSNGSTTLLQIGKVESDPGGTTELMKKLLKKAAESGLYNKLTLLSVQSWNRYAAGALACSFSYETPAEEGKDPTPVAGLSVLVPARIGKTTYYTIYSDAANIDKDTWEIANALRYHHVRGD